MIQVQEGFDRALQGGLSGYSTYLMTSLGGTIAQGAIDLGRSIFGQSRLALFGPMRHQVVRVSSVAAGILANLTGRNVGRTVLMAQCATLLITQGGWSENIPSVVEDAHQLISTTINAYYIAQIISLPLQRIIPSLR